MYWAWSTVHTVDKGTHPPGRLRLIRPRWCVDESLPLMAVHHIRRESWMAADHRHSRPGATRYDRRGATHLESIAGLRTVIWYLPTSSGVCQGAVGSMTLLDAHSFTKGRSRNTIEQRSRLLGQLRAAVLHKLPYLMKWGARRPHGGGEGVDTGVERHSLLHADALELSLRTHWILSLGQGQSALHAWPTHAGGGEGRVERWRGGQLSRGSSPFLWLCLSLRLTDESQGRLTVSALLKLRVTAVLA